MRYFFMEIQDARDVWVLHKVIVAPDFRTVLDVPMMQALAAHPNVRYRPMEAVVVETTIPVDITVPVVIVDAAIQVMSYREYLNNYIIQSDDGF